MKQKVIITIGRQFGSGGAEVGEKLAKALGIAYYDKALLVEAAKESGLCEEAFKKADEQALSGLSYAIPMSFQYMTGYMPYVDILSKDDLFCMQSNTIRNLAEKGSCVLVGRCADYVLRDAPNCISFFILNKQEVRMQRVMNDFDLTEEKASELILKTDKQRAAYYDFYSNKEWGKASSYNYCLDVSVLGVDETVAMMVALVERFINRD